MPDTLDITLSNAQVDENTPSSTLVGVFATVPAGGILTLLDDAGGRFALDGDTLVVGPIVGDYETGATATIEVKAERAGKERTETFTITYVNLNEITDVVISNDMILENAGAGTVVGALTSVPPGATFDVVGDALGYFDIVGSNLVAGGTALDYEDLPDMEGHTFPVQIEATLGVDSGVFTIPVSVIDVQEISDITLSSATIDEGSASGTVVGSLASVPSGATWTLLDSAGGRFAIVGNTVTAGSVPTVYDTAASHQITVRGVRLGEAFEKSFTITVNNINSILDITLAGATVAEGAAPGVVVGTFTTDPAGLPLSLTDTAGTRFALSGNDLVTGATATNFEAATSHIVGVRATFGSDTRDETFTITVTDVDEISDVTLSAAAIPENSAAGAIVGTLSSTPAGATFTVTTQTPAGAYFTVNGSNQLVAGATATDFETNASHSVTVRGTRGGETFDKVFTITVTNAQEITDITLSAASIAENSAAGVVVGALTSTPPGATFAIASQTPAGNYFAVTGGNLVTGATATDFETNTSHSVTIQATLGPDTFSKAFTVAVTDVGEVAPAQWWQPGAYADFDVENNRYMVNGVEYASSAAMIAAGAATAVSGGGWNLTAPVGVTQISVVADGVSSATATPAALEYLFSFDDGGASLTDEFAYVGRTTTNTMQSGITTASASVGTIPLGALGASTAVRVSERFKTNAFVASKDGGSGVEDTVGGLPTTGRFTVGNRYDGLRPWGGTIKRVTILLTREFSKEQCELMSGVGLMRGLVWSWWNKQLAFTQAGKTYLIAFNTRDKRQYSVVLDAVSRKVLDFKALTAANEVPQDDHSTGAYPGALLPNGQLCQINGGHDNEAFLRFQRSTNDMPGNLGATIQIPLGYASTVSYAQLFLNGTDLYAVCQTRGNAYWDIFKSTDYGDTWTRLKTLVHGTTTGGGGPNQWYIAASDVNSGVITFYTQQHPGNLQNQIRRFSLNLNTGDLSISGAVVGSIYAGTNDTAITEISACELIRTPASGHSQRLLAVRGDGMAITIADTADAFVTCNYLLGLDTGTWAFNTVVAGSSFNSTNNPSYVGGMIFAEHTHTGHLLYTARQTGGNWLLEQQASTDGITFTPTTILNNATVKTMRPICPKGATSALAVMVQSATSYNDFNDMVVDGRVYAAAA